MCNVIAAGMSKRAKCTQFLRNYTNYNIPFLRRTTSIWGTQDLPGRFKEWKACLVRIGHTAHKLETNAHANFPMAENLAYQCMENGGRNMPTRIFLWLTVALRYNIETNSST